MGILIWLREKIENALAKRRVAKNPSQYDLLCITRNENISSETRMTAAKMITDQHALASLLYGIRGPVYKFVFELVTDQEVLKKLATKEYYIAKNAVNRITDESSRLALMAELLERNDGLMYEDDKIDLLQKIHDQESLANIFRATKSERLRDLAFQKIHDPDLRTRLLIEAGRVKFCICFQPEIYHHAGVGHDYCRTCDKPYREFTYDWNHDSIY